MADSNSENRVVHDYHDRAKEPDPAHPSFSSDGATSVQTCNGHTEHSFPMKLHYMLSSVEADGQSHIVSFQPHGRCFVVHDQKEFVANMLPLWFRQSKFASFQRQLNLYGFQRISKGPDKGGYYHEYLLRCRPLLAQKITRTKVKGKGARKASSPETEPNLYEYPWMKERDSWSESNNSMESPLTTSSRVSANMHNPLGFDLGASANHMGATQAIPNPTMALSDAVRHLNFELPQNHEQQQQQQQQHANQAALRSLLSSTHEYWIPPAQSLSATNNVKTLEDNPSTANMDMLASDSIYDSILAALKANSQQQQFDLRNNGPSAWFTQPGPSFF